MGAEKKLKMQLQCPMPKLDFDIITLGHGSGGLLTNRLLDSGVFDLLKNELLDERHDGAIFDIEAGRMAFSTDSYVISPIFFPGGNIGELAVNGTVNDLAMCGAQARYLSLSFILEEGLTMREFWEVLVGIKYAAENAGVKIVTGDTKVVERGKGDKIFINTSGVGMLHPRAEIRKSRVQVGDKILISGPIATHGIAILSVRQGLDFETSIVSDSTNLNHTVISLLDVFGPDIHLLHDPTRGGVATVLNELARDTRLGIDLEERAIPVLEEVAGACELLGLDPLYVANEGVFITIVAAEAAESVLEVLRADPNGASAAIIGTVTEEHPRQVLLHSKIGGKRVVNMPVGEQLPRIC
jgi:hydrogenase expression/formation protein HypE